MKALALWSKLGIEKAHVVSHDMGDSVLTEILTRCLHQIIFFLKFIPTPHRLERGALPDRFANFFQSVVFTNGGMRYHLINFRLAQVEFSIFNLRHHLKNFRLAQVEFSL